MAEPKPIAALSSTLLARKGYAKPAMRPSYGAPIDASEDLGWDDMGAEDMPAKIAELPSELPRNRGIAQISAADNDAGPKTGLLRSKSDVKIVSEAESCPEPTIMDQARKIAQSRTAKAAFTLRVDAERHLKLRLACVLNRASAQTIVTEALDRYLDAVPEIAELVAKAPPRKHSRKPK